MTPEKLALCIKCGERRLKKVLGGFQIGESLEVYVPQKIPYEIGVLAFKYNGKTYLIRGKKLKKIIAKSERIPRKGAGVYPHFELCESTDMGKPNYRVMITLEVSV